MGAEGFEFGQCVYDSKLLWRANLYVDDGAQDWNNTHPWNDAQNNEWFVSKQLGAFIDGGQIPIESATRFTQYSTSQGTFTIPQAVGIIQNTVAYSWGGGSPGVCPMSVADYNQYLSVESGLIEKKRSLDQPYANLDPNWKSGTTTAPVNGGYPFPNPPQPYKNLVQTVFGDAPLVKDGQLYHEYVPGLTNYAMWEEVGRKDRAHLPIGTIWSKAQNAYSPGVSCDGFASTCANYGGASRFLWYPNGISVAEYTTPEKIDKASTLIENCHIIPGDILAMGPGTPEQPISHYAIVQSVEYQPNGKDVLLSDIVLIEAAAGLGDNKEYKVQNKQTFYDYARRDLQGWGLGPFHFYRLRY